MEQEVPGAGRRRRRVDRPMKTATVTLDAYVMDEIDEIAVRTGYTRSRVMRDLLSEALMARGGVQ